LEPQLAPQPEAAKPVPSIPGYRDILRGSNIRPFTHLSRMRVVLPGLAAQELTIAAVHTGGESGVTQAAERIAAMRSRVLHWRGSYELRATDWVDGSGFDRCLAVHDGACLIGARTSLPRLLGDRAPSARVVNLSSMRRRVMLLVTIQDVTRYLPALQACELHSLRISVSTDMHLSITAEYQTPVSAAHAPACLESLQDPRRELHHTRAMLARADAPSGSDRSQLKTGVTHDEIEELLDELCWSLRHVAHT
jgi:hypothetical protein